jgi:hypothetical protein
MSSKILRKHKESVDFDGSFDYRLVVVKLNYLEKGTCADISYITHQCGRLALDPKQEHPEADSYKRILLSLLMGMSAGACKIYILAMEVCPLLKK